MTINSLNVVAWRNTCRCIVERRLIILHNVTRTALSLVWSSKETHSDQQKSFMLAKNVTIASLNCAAWRATYRYIVVCNVINNSLILVIWWDTFCQQCYNNFTEFFAWIITCIYIIEISLIIVCNVTRTSLSLINQPGTFWSTVEEKTHLDTLGILILMNSFANNVRNSFTESSSHKNTLAYTEFHCTVLYCTCVPLAFPYHSRPESHQRTSHLTIFRFISFNWSD